MVGSGDGVGVVCGYDKYKFFRLSSNFSLQTNALSLIVSDDVIGFTMSPETMIKEHLVRDKRFSN